MLPPDRLQEGIANMDGERLGGTHNGVELIVGQTNEHGAPRGNQEGLRTLTPPAANWRRTRRWHRAPDLRRDAAPVLRPARLGHSRRRLEISLSRRDGAIVAHARAHTRSGQET